MTSPRVTAVTFDADLQHDFENEGDEDARFYAIV